MEQCSRADELNRLIVKVCGEFGVQLISTADSHYPNRTAWKDRELYKRLGWLSKGMPKWAKNTELPQGVEKLIMNSSQRMAIKCGRLTKSIPKSRSKL